jgi:outer membrane lipoprotein SlyB
VINRAWKWLMVCVLPISLIACTGPQPTLRSNKQLHMYGAEVAQQEIDACLRKIERAGLEAGDHGRSTNVATGAVLGMVIGGATGASAGMWGGLPGIAIGAAAGSGLGLILGAAGGRFKPLEPDLPYADAVTKCLKDKGYEVSGWE